MREVIKVMIKYFGTGQLTHCTRANIYDDQGLIEILTINIDYFPSKTVELPITTILLDNGYHPSKLESELKKVYPEIMTKIQFKLAPKQSRVRASQSCLTKGIRTI